MTPVVRVAFITAAVLSLLALVAGARYQHRRAAVTEVYAPTFPTVEFAGAGDALGALDERLQSDAHLSTLRQVLPDQAGVLWIALLVMLMAGFDYAQPRSWRNVDLIVVHAIGWCFIGSLDMLVQTTGRTDPLRHGLIRLVFEIVAVLSFLLVVRLTWRALHPQTSPWIPAVGVQPLAAIAAITVTLSLAIPFLRPVEDSTYFTALGAQRLRERGSLPYGDPMLTNSPGAAYAPLMYAAQAAIQTLLLQPVNADSPDRPELGERSQYLAPSPLPGSLLLAASQLLAVWALWRIGSRWGEAQALALISLYCGSAAVLGVGGSGDQVTGMTFASHIVPPALMLVAFLKLDRPAVAGLWLAAAAATGFYPAFSLPAWAAYQWGQSRRAFVLFAAGFGALSLVVGLWVLAASQPADGMSVLGTVLRDTLGHQTDPKGYGSAPFGLWGQQSGIMRWLFQPLVGASALTAPGFLVFVAYLGFTAVLARRTGPVGLALLSATAALGANLWRIPGTGSYMNWYYPFLLIGVLGPWTLIRSQVTRAEKSADA